MERRPSSFQITRRCRVPDRAAAMIEGYNTAFVHTLIEASRGVGYTGGAKFGMWNGGWMQYADARIDTAHDYSGDKADWCLELVGGFIDDAVRLYERMTGETWS